jgi:hypothetical protein
MADEAAQVPGGVVQSALGSPLVRVRQHARVGAGHARLLQHALVLGGRQILVEDGPARLTRDLGGQLGQGEGGVARQLIDVVLVASAGERLHRRGGVVHPARGEDNMPRVTKARGQHEARKTAS